MTTDNIRVEFTRGDQVYNHNVGGMVKIETVTLTPQRQLQYHYSTEDGGTGVAQASDLGDKPCDNLDANTDNVLINQCSIADVLAAFPNLPGGKGVLARKIIQTRNEQPFDGEISFINRMIEIAPKVDWEQISYKLNYERLTTIEV